MKTKKQQKENQILEKRYDITYLIIFMILIILWISSTTIQQLITTTILIIITIISMYLNYIELIQNKKTK